MKKLKYWKEFHIAENCMWRDPQCFSFDYVVEFLDLTDKNFPNSEVFNNIIDRKIDVPKEYWEILLNYWKDYCLFK